MQFAYIVGNFTSGYSNIKVNSAGFIVLDATVSGGSSIVIQRNGDTWEIVNAAINGGAATTLLDTSNNALSTTTHGVGFAWTGETPPAHFVGGDLSDMLLGGNVDDTLEGGLGNDSVYGSAGSDSLLGGDGNDSMRGGDGNDTMLGEAGNDSQIGEAGNDSLVGGDGNDSMRGGNDNDTLLGEAGNDTLLGEAGNDSLIGGDGADSISGGNNDDTLLGGDGNDTMSGDSGTDLLDGGNGDDIFLDPNGDTIATFETVDIIRLTGGAAIALTASHLQYDSGAKTLTVDYDKNGTFGGGTDIVIAFTNAPAAGSFRLANNASFAEITLGDAPSITSAAYDASTGVLAIIGANMVTGDTIDVSKLTLTGEGDATCTLTAVAGITASNDVAFSVTLNAADKLAVNQILNKNGAASTGLTTYNLAAAEGWAAGAAATVNVADTTGNGVTVSNVAVPTITSATYDAGNGALIVTGTGFLKRSGAANDIDVFKLSLVGEGNSAYTMTTTGVEITNNTIFTVTLNATDLAAVNQILNKNGTNSTGATTYNLAAAEDWAAGADATVVIADLVGNDITVSNVAVPTIASATYDTGSGVLTVTGTNFLKYAGPTNDVDISKLTLTGKGGAGTSYTLTSATDVEISSGTSFSVTLSSADKTAVNALFDKTGLSANDTTVYNLAAADNWLPGAEDAVDITDLTGNGINVSVYVPPPPKSLAYGTTTFVEATANDGSITTTSTITLTNDSFTGVDGANLGVVSHVPAGLTAHLVKVDATHATLSFIGNAAAHANANDIANLTVIFGDDDFSSHSAATVTRATTSNLVVDFADPVAPPPPPPKFLTFSATSFVEAVANDGSIATISTITLTNDTFTGDNGTNLGVVSHVPAGLTAHLVKLDATHATLSFTGNAAAHANANDIANLTVSLGDGNFTGNSAVTVTGATTSNLVVDFADPVTPPNSNDTDHDQFPDHLEAANGLSVGVKDNDVFGSSKLFAMQLYRDVLYREGESDGLQFWQEQINSGRMNRAEVAASFLDSSEFQSGAGIVRLYFGALQRLPDPEGLDHWLGQSHSGVSLSQIGEAFAASPEFISAFGDLDNSAFVNQIYQNILGRSADAGGKDFWVERLESGVSRGSVVTGFTESAEGMMVLHSKVEVALDYVGLLGRAPEQQGFDYWVQQHDSGMPEVSIIGCFTACPEYHDRFLA